MVIEYCIAEDKTSANSYKKVNTLPNVNDYCNELPCLIGDKLKKQIDCTNFNYKETQDLNCKKLLVSFNERNYTLVTPESFNSTCYVLDTQYIKKPVEKKIVTSYVQYTPIQAYVELDDQCFEKPIIKNSFRLSKKDSETLRSLNKTLFDNDFKTCITKYNDIYNFSTDIDGFFSKARLMPQLLMLT